MYETKAKEQGFVALVVVIIISASLLIISATLSNTGYSSRFSVLGYENKRQATAMAEGCAEYARLLILQNSDYAPAAGGDLASLSTGSCRVCEVTGTGGAGSNREVATRSKKGNSISNIKTVMAVEDLDVTIELVEEVASYSGPACSL